MTDFIVYVRIAYDKQSRNNTIYNNRSNALSPHYFFVKVPFLNTNKVM